MRAVIANGLSKTYQPDKRALDGVSFELEQGEIFGFLGPNGAGKTTTVKLLAGLLSPTSGESSVFGENPDVSPEAIHAMSGIVTEHARMYDNMTGRRNLTFFGELFGVGASECEKRARSLLSQLDLEEAADRKLSTYSTGMRQRLSLARAMIHRPRILFLDEPTSGLDPASARHVNSMIRDLAVKDGTTVFLCTHQLRYAQEICTYYGLVDNGALLALGDIKTLRASVGAGLTAIVKSEGLPLGIEYKSMDDGFRAIRVSSQDDISDIARRIVTGGYKLFHISAQEPELEEVYFALIAKKEGEILCRDR